MAGNLGELKARLTADANGIKREIKNVKKDFTDMGTQAKQTAEDMQKLNKALADAGLSAEQISNINQAMAQATKSTNIASDAAKKMGNHAHEATGSFMKLNMALQDVGANSKSIEAINESIRRANPEILEQQLSSVRTELENLGVSGSAIDDIIERMRELTDATSGVEVELESMGAAYAAMAIAVGATIGKSIQTAAEFEQAMQNVKAITEAVGEDFEALRLNAIKLGAQTVFSASQAADAMAELGQAGFDTKEIIAAMPGVLALAAAGNVDLATTADIASSILRGFGIAATETSRVVDVLAKSSIDTNADVQDLGLSMKYVAPVAAAMGLSIEEATAAIGELSNAGMKGETAGTSLRAILLALASPSKEAAFYMQRLGVSIKDSAGNIVPLSNLIGQFTTVWSRLTEAQQADVAATLVGREAASGFITLIQQGQGTLDNYTESLKNAGGTAERVAGTQMDTLKGAADNMSSAFESAGIVIGDMFLPAVREAVEGVTTLLNGFTELDKPTQAAILTFTALPPLLLGAATTAFALKKAIDAVKASIDAAVLAGRIAQSTIPILGAIALAIGAVAAGASFLISKYKESKEATKNFEEAQKALNDTLNDSPVKRTADELTDLRTKTEELTKTLHERALLQERLNKFQAAWDKSEGTPQMMSEAMDINEQLEKIDKKLRSMGFDGVEVATAKLEEMNKAVRQSISALFDEQKAEVADLAAKNQKVKSMETALASYKKLSSSQKLNREQLQEMVDVTNILKREYPGLNAMQEEDGRIRILNVGFIEDQISADKTMTANAAANAQTRIDNLAAEADAQRTSVEAQIKNYSRLLDAMAAVNGAKASTFADSVKQGQARMSGKTPSVIDIVTNTAQAQAESELNKLTTEQRAIAEKQKEIEKAAASLSSGDFTLGANKGDPIDLTDPTKTKKEKEGKTAAELAAEARKAAYEADLKTIQFQADYYDLTADKQMEKYEALRKKHAKFLSESVDDARTLQLQLKRLGEDSVKSRYDFSATWIDAESKRMEDNGKSELQIAQMKLDSWTRLRDRYQKDSEQYKAADDQVRQSRKDVATETENEISELYDKRTKLIDKEVRRLEESGAAEADIAAYKVKAWTGLRNQYAVDTKYYEQADQELYQSRKDLTDKTLDMTKELVDAEKDRIEEAQKAELAAIEVRKDAYVSAQDAKIKAIDVLLAKEAEANEDLDYEEELAKKNARIDLLSSAVGNSGREERKKLIEERDKFVLDHERELRKRELTSQKDALQNEKDTKLQAFEDEKDATEAHYDDLKEAFDSYSDDIKVIEAGIADFRVSSAGTANTQILTELDAFIVQYQSKMSAISAAKEAAKKDADLAEYNANKDAYATAAAAGNRAEMQRLAARNQALRDLYGIDKDTGQKLQSFDVGGIIPGPAGMPVPIIAHGEEAIFNTTQLNGLFRILDNPNLLGGAAAVAKSETKVENHIDMSVNGITLEDRADTEILYTEREKSARRLQTMGVKSG
ncbi:phage tail tape measure protein [Paenibacillus tianjinensis]|uniref:Phage tail tape measure protein n=1 Tax=Paenibacillus tianjinensis TaxID=2810347 RepID=A0ABX7L8B8_9BACL|nr:phage tail tape measure protein [Paenibacillus tianjinensis]QSF42655.1 phage tail tape measure protein [Paenibacillus tianjinensis]